MATNDRQQKAQDSLTGVVERIYDQLDDGQIPTMELPLRSKKNIEFDSETTAATFSQKNHISVPLRSFGVHLSWRFGNLKASVKKTSRSINNDDVTKSSNTDNQSGGITTGM